MAEIEVVCMEELLEARTGNEKPSGSSSRPAREEGEVKERGKPFVEVLA